jgi:ribonuclease P protein component
VENKQRFRSLSRSKDFLNLKLHGRVFHVNSWLLVNLQKTSHKQIRCGWTIPRQIGPAVVRNRFKRWGREYIRKWSAENNQSLDLNLVFKRKEKGFYKSVNHKEFDGAMEKMVGKLERYVE